jgi:hypothetical protein
VIALYLDGVQKTHRALTATYAMLPDLFIGQRGTDSGYHDGTMEEIRIGKDNILGAAPVAGLTNTIAVPPSGFGFYGVN